MTRAPSGRGHRTDLSGSGVGGGDHLQAGDGGGCGHPAFSRHWWSSGLHWRHPLSIWAGCRLAENAQLRRKANI